MAFFLVQVPEPEWVVFADWTNREGRYIAKYDTMSIQREGESVQFWTKTGIPLEGQPDDFYYAQFEIQCVRRQWRIVAEIDNYADPNRSDDYIVSQEAFSPIAPESIEATLSRLVC